MKERPIIFSGEMVRAILEGRKTQTRRVVKGFAEIPSHVESHCPYGTVGDRLWVRETWAACHPGKDTTFDSVNPRPGVCSMAYKATDRRGIDGKWRPSIFMPRWASRITLEITGIRVERVQDINESDALAEGIQVSHYYCEEPTATQSGVHRCDPIGKYQELWDSINAKRGYGWDTNPFVWVIDFKREGIQQ